MAAPPINITDGLGPGLGLAGTWPGPTRRTVNYGYQFRRLHADALADGAACSARLLRVLRGNADALCANFPAVLVSAQYATPIYSFSELTDLDLIGVPYAGIPLPPGPRHITGYIRARKRSASADPAIWLYCDRILARDAGGDAMASTSAARASVTITSTSWDLYTFTAVRVVRSSADDDVCISVWAEAGEAGVNKQAEIAELFVWAAPVEGVDDGDAPALVIP